MSEPQSQMTSPAILKSFIHFAAVCVLLACVLPVHPAAAAAPNDISGVWYDDTGKGAVELYPCRGGVCGRIVWLRRQVNKAGQPLRDIYNPAPGQRQRTICGLKIVAGIQPQSDGTWDGGRIYDPKVGKSYDVAIERINADRLRITGYLGVKMFGKSFIWRRAPTSLARCSAG